MAEQSNYSTALVAHGLSFNNIGCREILVSRPNYLSKSTLLHTRWVHLFIKCWFSSDFNVWEVWQRFYQQRLGLKPSVVVRYMIDYAYRVLG